MPNYRNPTKPGAPPGTLVYTGAHRDSVRFTLFNYDEERCEEIQPKTVQECIKYKEAGGVTWLNVDGLNQIEVIAQLGDAFDLHPLVQEDILQVGQRPKVENYSEYLYVVIRMLSYNDVSHKIESEQVSLILGKQFVISFQEKAGDVFDAVRERIRNPNARIRKMKADYLLYALMDSLVDNYFSILEHFGDRIEQVENKLVEDVTTTTLRDIHRMKRSVLDLRKSIWPLREAVNSLYRGDSSLVTEPTQLYLRDVYDHTIQVMDTVETFRDILSGVLDLYLSSIGNRTNEVMKVLTIMASIFIPLTLIAGIYGMNFQHMPELDEPWGYPAALLLMVLTGGAMLVYFKYKDWL